MVEQEKEQVTGLATDERLVIDGVELVEYSVSLDNVPVNSSNSEIGYVFQKTNNYENRPVQFDMPSFESLENLSNKLKTHQKEYTQLESQKDKLNATYFNSERKRIIETAKMDSNMLLAEAEFEIDKAMKREKSHHGVVSSFDLERDNSARLLNITMANAILSTNNYEMILGLAKENVANHDIRTLVKAKAFQMKVNQDMNEELQRKWLALDVAIKEYEEKLHFGSDYGKLELMKNSIQQVKQQLKNGLFIGNAKDVFLNNAKVEYIQFPFTPYK